MRNLILILSGMLMLVGCETDPGTDLQDNINTVRSVAVFNPSDGEIPFPNNLLFVGTTDGTVNIPVVDAADLADPKVALNGLDGFSTNAPITATFSSPIESATIAGNVRVFSAVIDDFYNNPAVPPAPTFGIAAITGELTANVDYFASVSAQTTLVISPLKPLAPKSGYVVVVTNGLKSTNGVAFKPDTTYAIVKQTETIIKDGKSLIPAVSDEDVVSLEGLRLQTNNNEAKISAASDIASSDIILSWTFTTQSSSDVLALERGELLSATPVLSAFTKQVALRSGLLLQGVPVTGVDIYTGTIDVPYYLSKTNPLSGVWVGSNDALLSLANLKNPVPTETLSIPILITVPTDAAENDISPPVVIYQHGITTERTTGLALADTLAAAGGRAMVAIDLPLHGVASSSPFYDAANERTFDLDLVNNDTGEEGADTVADTSGKHFINLASLQTSRDNVRQAVLDLVILTNAIGSINLDGDGDTDLDANNISFIGHSLGGIVGVPFIALETRVQSAVFAMVGGGIAKILDGSATFGPVISAGLATKEVIKGTADFESFMVAAQTVLDSADPLNYGVDALANRSVLFFEIVGSATSPSDLVIPNTVPDTNDTTGTVAAPLAGTEPLIGPAVMGLTQLTETTSEASTGAGLDVVVKFNAGHHGSLLTPKNAAGENDAPSAAVITEIHKILGTFLGTGGATVAIDDTTVIATP